MVLRVFDNITPRDIRQFSFTKSTNLTIIYLNNRLVNHQATSENGNDRSDLPSHGSGLQDHRALRQHWSTKLEVT